MLYLIGDVVNVGSEELFLCFLCLTILFVRPIWLTSNAASIRFPVTRRSSCLNLLCGGLAVATSPSILTRRGPLALLSVSWFIWAAGGGTAWRRVRNS